MTLFSALGSPTLRSGKTPLPIPGPRGYSVQHYNSQAATETLRRGAGPEADDCAKFAAELLDSGEDR